MAPYSNTGTQRCTCKAHGCIDQESEDPDTHIVKPGIYLHPSTVQRHAQDNKIFTRLQEASSRPDPESQILAATLARRDDVDSDPVVTARASFPGGKGQVDQHSRASSLLPSVQSQAEEAEPSTTQGAIEDQLAQKVVMFASDDDVVMAEPPDPEKAALRAIAEARGLFNALRNSFLRPPGGLIFEQKPTASSSNTPGPLDFKASVGFIQHQHSVEKIVEVLDGISSDGSLIVRAARKKLIEEIEEHINVLNRYKVDEWSRQKTEVVLNETLSPHLVPKLIETRHHFTLLDELGQIAAPILACMLTAVVLHILSGLSRNHSNFLLLATRTIVTSACLTIVNNLGKDIQARNVLRKKVLIAASDWPTDVRTAVQRFNLDPKLVEYVCCKACHTLYGPQANTEENPNIPKTCTFRETPSSPVCNTPLIDGDGKSLCRFMYQPIATWLGRILSRPGIPQAIRTSLDGEGARMYDIWDGDVFQQFKGPDGKSYFEISNPSSELRLVFSLFVDWFSPWGSKKNGPHTSVGGIYLVCHNLPVHLRYRIENVYIAGIIPGPKEPQLHHLNHLLRPLVDDLLCCWSPGIFLTRTALHQFGCLVRCVVIPLVCDLPALRKAAGYAAHSADKFCSFCLQQKSDIANFNITSWKRRSWKEHLELAIAWRDAASESIRNSLFDQSGLRWSELLRLPYWDPTRFSVVESMHNLFLGELQHHCRQILGMNAESIDAENARTPPHTPEEQQAWLNVGINAIQQGSSSTLKSLRRGYIVALAHANNIDPRPPLDDNPLKHQSKRDQSVGKADYAKALMEWYRTNDRPEIRCPKPFPRPIVDLSTAWINAPKVVVLNKDILSEVWADMKKTTLPTWMSRAPRNLGCSSHGKLKADQWRTACMVNLPITLCRLWGTASADPKKKAILLNFMSLVIAVRWATMRSTSSEHIKIIEAHFLYYMKTVVEIFGEGCLVVNNHLSFHLAECIRGFGPVHGWWAFPFERFNGILQRYKTNHKIGELELTFIRTFCRGGSLKALMAQKDLPDALSELRPIIQDYFGSDFRGTLLTDLLSTGASDDGSEIPAFRNSDPTVLPDNIYTKLLACINREPGPAHFISYRSPPSHLAQFLEPQAQYRKSIRYRGIVFATAAQHTGNSYVLFRKYPGGNACAGQIHQIFVHSRTSKDGQLRTEFFYVIRPLLALDSDQAAHDPYRFFALLDTQLYKDEFDPEEVVVRTTDIVSHFASCPYENPEMQGKYRVVVSLDRN